MKCPLCHKELYAVGEKSFYNPIGYACPTRITITVVGSGFKAVVSHYEIRGARTEITLPDNYTIVTWGDPMETNGHSTIKHYVDGIGWKEIFHCNELPIESEEKLLKRIKLLAVFS